MALDCILDSGYVLDCNSIGGVERVWIGTYSSLTSYTLDIDNVITGATAANTLYSFEQDIEFAGLEQAGNFSRENGTVFYESNLSLKFTNLDKDLRNTLVAIGRAPLYAVVKSNAGLYYLLGLETAGRATEGVASLGVALGDMNGATLTVQWKSAQGAFLLDEAILGSDLPTA